MKILVCTLWVSLVLLLAYLPEQSSFPSIAAGYTLLFGLYLFAYRYFRKHADILFMLFFSLFLRALTLFAFPNLSDDIYRFLWDGHLINTGVNPYLFTPSEWIATNAPAEVFPQLYPLLNSPDYHSVYPPVCQALFALVTLLFDSPFWSSVMLKLLFLAAEAGTIYILMKFVQQVGQPLKRVLLYALNPLIIIELTGNLHFEAIMIFFLLASFWFFARKRYLLFGFLFGLSVLTKLLPLMFIPFFIRRIPWPQLLAALSLIIATISLGFLPFIDQEFLTGLSTSLDLYFRKFEFNASIYYVCRAIGYWWKGFNMIHSIGPVLALVTLLSILFMSWKERNLSVPSLFKHCLLAFTLYLALATTVHPWYVAMPIALSVFTRFRFPLFWSGLITLTYINYWGGDYHERLGIVVIEYLLVLLILYLEVFRVPLVRSIAVQSLRLFRRVGGWLNPGDRK